MAIKGPWVGSSAKAETGQSWMAAAGATVKLQPAFWMSNMVGKSKAVQVYINSSDHNYNADKLLNAVRAVMPQDKWSGMELQLHVGSGVQLVSSTTGAPCLDFGRLSAFAKITLENSGTILGRGGNGGGKDRTKGGYPGGTAIRRNATLYINNHGVIGGGGGGGGIKGNGGAGGGCPFGSGGLGIKVMGSQGYDGQNASFSSAGAGGGSSGAGGWYGKRGVTAYDPYPGGAAGAAIDGSGTFGWINRGTVYGSAP